MHAAQVGSWDALDGNVMKGDEHTGLLGTSVQCVTPVLRDRDSQWVSGARHRHSILKVQDQWRGIRKEDQWK